LPLRRRLSAVMEEISAFTDGGEFALCRELAALGPAMDAELAVYQRTYKNTLYALIDEGMAAGYMKSGPDRELIFYYIDMGVRYYQQNEEYRLRMRGDKAFRDRYMLFFIGNIFTDGAAVLTGA